jgi:hypothetical protein
MARHKKTRKTRRRRSMRGGAWYNPFSWWGKPAQVATTGVSTTVTDTTKAAAPMVPSAPAQAAALGTSPGGTVSTGAPILGSTAATPLGTGGRRRRKTRRRH